MHLLVRVVTFDIGVYSYAVFVAIVSQFFFFCYCDHLDLHVLTHSFPTRRLSDRWMGLRYMAVAGIIINLVLMVLNLIPLPPLDGGRVLTGLLPPRAAFQFAKLERYGLFILLGLIMIPGLLGAIMYWPLAIAEFSLYSLLGLDASTALMSGP